MPSTNKTEHYGLTQYEPQDIPSYLVDYNNDMQKIDETLFSLSEGEVTPTTSKVNSILKNKLGWIQENMTKIGNQANVISPDSLFYISYNDDMSIFNFYGYINIVCNQVSMGTDINFTGFTVQSALRPNKKLEFNCIGTAFGNTPFELTGVKPLGNTFMISCTIDTDGLITVQAPYDDNFTSANMFYMINATHIVDDISLVSSVSSPAQPTEYTVINFTNTNLDAVSNINYPDGYTSDNCVIISFMTKVSTATQGFTNKTRYVEEETVYDLVCQLSPSTIRILDTYSFIKDTAMQYKIVLMKVGE